MEGGIYKGEGTLLQALTFRTQHINRTKFNVLQMEYVKARKLEVRESVKLIREDF